MTMMIDTTGGAKGHSYKRNSLRPPPLAFMPSSATCRPRRACRKDAAGAAMVITNDRSPSSDSQTSSEEGSIALTRNQKLREKQATKVARLTRSGDQASLRVPTPARVAARETTSSSIAQDTTGELLEQDAAVIAGTTSRSKSKKIPMEVKLANYELEYVKLKFEEERLSKKYPNLVEPAQGPRRGVRPKDNNFMELLVKIHSEYAAYKTKKKKAEFSDNGKDVRHQLRNKISAAENRLLAKLTDLRKNVQLMQHREKESQLAELLDSSVRRQELANLRKALMASLGQQYTSDLSTEAVLRRFFEYQL